MRWRGERVGGDPVGRLERVGDQHTDVTSCAHDGAAPGGAEAAAAAAVQLARFERLFAAEAKVWALLGAAPELATEGEAGWACGPKADSSQDGEEEEEGEEGEEGDEEVADA